MNPGHTVKYSPLRHLETAAKIFSLDNRLQFEAHLSKLDVSWNELLSSYKTLDTEKNHMEFLELS